MSSTNSIVVKKTFDISGNGIGILPFESLPINLFRKRFKVLIELTNGQCFDGIATVESLIINASQKQESFTFFLEFLKSKDIPKNTKISIIEELYSQC